ncbi:MAG: hypothetical protein KIT84_04405 [Labilithrix sp.]|nr:hypothetical protein [Labilithrix sp.]MCW5810228.1 hypothetical protein [Labilithrix sp.]
MSATACSDDETKNEAPPAAVGTTYRGVLVGADDFGTIDLTLAPKAPGDVGKSSIKPRNIIEQYTVTGTIRLNTRAGALTIQGTFDTINGTITATGTTDVGISFDGAYKDRTFEGTATIGGQTYQGTLRDFGVGPIDRLCGQVAGGLAQGNAVLLAQRGGEKLAVFAFAGNGGSGVVNAVASGSHDDATFSASASNGITATGSLTRAGDEFASATGEVRNAAGAASTFQVSASACPTEASTTTPEGGTDPDSGTLPEAGPEPVPNDAGGGDGGTGCLGLQSPSSFVTDERANGAVPDPPSGGETVVDGTYVMTARTISPQKPGGPQTVASVLRIGTNAAGRTYSKITTVQNGATRKESGTITFSSGMYQANADCTDGFDGDFGGSSGRYSLDAATLTIKWIGQGGQLEVYARQ